MKQTAPILSLITAAVSALAAEPSAESVRDEYLELPRLTEKPKSVAAEFSGLCFLGPEARKAIKDLGPHAMHFIHFYANEDARKRAALKSSEAFPVGSVIVKEKLTGTKRVEPQSMNVEAVAGMIKRAAGTLPKSGDWEFFYFDRSTDAKGKVRWTKGADMSHCAGCHSSATDFVFARFTLPYVVRGDGTPGIELKLQTETGDNLQLAPPK